MGRLIDEDILIDAIPDLSVFEEEDFCTSDMIRLIEDTPTVEAIPKDQYEARLRADMVAMLEDLDLQIDESAAYNLEVAKVQRLIRDKIKALKENKDVQNNIHN